MDSPAHDRGHDRPATRARVAFYGRVARDEQPPLCLQRQSHAARAALGTMTPVVLCYADVGPYHGVGTGGRSVAGCWLGDDQVAGGMEQLLARAARAEHDFEVVAYSSIDRLSLRHLDAVRIEAQLAEHTVRVVTADEPAIGVPSSLGDVPDAHTMHKRDVAAMGLGTGHRRVHTALQHSTTNHRRSAVLIRGSQGQRGGEAVAPRPGHRAEWGLLGDAHCLLGVDRGVLDHRIPHYSQARLRKEGRQ